jgi:hypothetical protein
MAAAAAHSPDEGTTRISNTSDVQRALSAVRDRAASRSLTADLQRTVTRADRLHELRPEPALPVAEQLRDLLPWAGLRRGAVVAVNGSTLLLLALLGEASRAGAWIGVIGWPDLNPSAAHEAGIDLRRFGLVPHPGSQWLEAAGILIDGLDIVVVRTPPGGVTEGQARTLAARSRQRGAVLLPVGPGWPSPDLTLERTGGSWHGLGMGVGRLRYLEAEITARGRGGATRPRRCTVALPLACRPETAPASQQPRHLRAVG